MRGLFAPLAPNRATSPARILAAIAVVGLAATSLVGCSGGDGVEQLSVEVLAEHAHDPEAFTQGLAFDDDVLVESTGLNGQSSIRLVETDGGVIDRVDLDEEFFAEGAAVLDGEIVQLTWTSGVAFRWQADSLEPIGEFTYGGEGWGLTLDSAEGRWIQSDGSATLTFRDPDDFAELGSVDVTRDGSPVDQLNELEWVDGELWANVWKSTEIVRIDPDSGEVTGVIDAAELVPSGLDDPQAVLNGIAHRPGDPSDRLWLTGKLWPTMYEVRVVPA
jgi:glutamine cyclotransferase